jgi:conjugal transfer pilus assembly protein TraF
MRLLQPILFVMLAVLLLPVVFAQENDYPSGIDYQSVWACHGQEKFNWYCEEEVKQKDDAPETLRKTKEEKAVEELDKIRKDLDAKRALSVVHPTPENIKS